MLKPMDNGAFPAIVMARWAGPGPIRTRVYPSSALIDLPKSDKSDFGLPPRTFEAHRMSDLKDEFDPPFETLEPTEWRGPVVFNSPHSGNVYPRAFLAASRLDVATLRRSEDSFVDELTIGVVRRGYPLMRAHFPRCYVDVNRE